MHLVVPFGEEAASASRLYAEMTGRVAAPICYDFRAINPDEIAVLVTTTEQLNPQLLEWLYSDSRSYASGLIHGSDGDDLCRRAEAIAAHFLVGPRARTAVELYPSSEMVDQTSGIRRVLGSGAPVPVVRAAITQPSAILTMLTHANGYDINLGSGLVLCDASVGRGRDLEGAPCCQFTGTCFRLHASMSEAATSELIVRPDEIDAHILALCVCDGLLTARAADQWGFASALLERGGAAALITSWSILVPRAREVARLLSRLYQGDPVGVAVGRLNSSDTNIRLAVLGDPEARIEPLPDETIRGLDYSEPDDPVIGDGGRFLQVMLYAVAVGTEGRVSSLALSAVDAARLFEHVTGLGLANTAPQAAAELRSRVTAFLSAYGGGAVMHFWTPLAGHRRRRPRQPCPSCHRPADVFRFDFRPPGLQPRELVICADCGISRDAILGSHAALTRRGDSFIVHLPEVQKDWAGVFHLRCQDRELSHVYVWPAESDGTPHPTFAPPRPWPPGPVTAVLNVLDGTDLTLVATPAVT